MSRKSVVRNIPSDTRVKINWRSPWKERENAVGVIVAPDPQGAYPQPAKWECIVLLDDDPMGIKYEHSAKWTCVLSKTCVEEL